MRAFPQTATEFGFLLFVVLALFLVVGTFLLLPDIVRNPHDWAQLIGAAVGFLGLGAAALFNAELTRQRDNRRDRESSDAIRGALAGELRVIRGYIDEQRHKVDWQNIVHDHAPSPKTIPRLRDWYDGTQPRVYEGLQDRMDSLTPEECAYLAWVYSRLRRHRARIQRLIDLLRTSDPQTSSEAIAYTAEDVRRTEIPKRFNDAFGVLAKHANRDLPREVPKMRKGRPTTASK